MDISLTNSGIFHSYLIVYFSCTPNCRWRVSPRKTTTVVLITSKALSLIQSVSRSIPVSALNCLCRWALHAKAFTG